MRCYLMFSVTCPSEIYYSGDMKKELLFCKELQTATRVDVLDSG